MPDKVIKIAFRKPTGIFHEYIFNASCLEITKNFAMHFSKPLYEAIKDIAFEELLDMFNGEEAFPDYCSSRYDLGNGELIESAQDFFETSICIFGIRKSYTEYEENLLGKYRVVTLTRKEN